jgi:hypothetical protein
MRKLKSKSAGKKGMLKNVKKKASCYNGGLMAAGNARYRSVTTGNYFRPVKSACLYGRLRASSNLVGKATGSNAV